MEPPSRTTAERRVLVGLLRVRSRVGPVCSCSPASILRPARPSGVVPPVRRIESSKGRKVAAPQGCRNAARGGGVEEESVTDKHYTTPELASTLVARLVQYGDLQAGDRVLDPCVGMGAFANAVKAIDRPNVSVVTLDQDDAVAADIHSE